MRLSWEYHDQSQETNWRHCVTGPEVTFSHKRKSILKINQSVKMLWHSCGSCKLLLIGLTYISEYPTRLPTFTFPTTLLTRKKTTEFTILILVENNRPASHSTRPHCDCSTQCVMWNEQKTQRNNNFLWKLIVQDKSAPVFQSMWSKIKSNFASGTHHFFHALSKLQPNS